jgi:hypothetical protein
MCADRNAMEWVDAWLNKKDAASLMMWSRDLLPTFSYQQVERITVVAVSASRIHRRVADQRRSQSRHQAWPGPQPGDSPRVGPGLPTGDVGGGRAKTDVRRADCHRHYRPSPALNPAFAPRMDASRFFECAGAQSCTVYR